MCRLMGIGIGEYVQFLENQNRCFFEYRHRNQKQIWDRYIPNVDVAANATKSNNSWNLI